MNKSVLQDIVTSYDIEVRCSCDKTYKVMSSKKENIAIEICSQCHPFYTGKDKIIDTEGRVDKFNKRYNMTK